jgi:glycosyltransferase involved in cell wall biosynthesis
MGGQRPYGWFKNFKQFGWDPVVVTRHWPEETKSKIDYNRSCGTEVSIEQVDEGTIIRVPYRENLRDKILIKYGVSKYNLLRSSLTLLQSALQFITFLFDNRAPIYFEANKFLNTCSVDLIIATGEPFVLFRYAHKLSKRHSVPWIADYRDCWSDNFEVNRNGGINKFIYKWLYKRLEKKYVKTASCITTAAPFFQKQLKQLFPKHNIEVVYNGFKELIQNSTQKTTSKEFTIAFAGTIYPFQPIELFLEGLEHFVEKHSNIKLRVTFYGTDYLSRQKERILSYSTKLCSYIVTTPRLSQKELYVKLSNSDILLLLNNYGMISGKLYEYLVFNKNILLVGRDFGSMEEILINTNTGIVCDTPEQIVEALGIKYKEWKQTGNIRCNSRNIQKYSRKVQAKHLTEIIKNY